MIANLKPYTVYKDSGAPWLGQVPAHWEIRSLGSLTSALSLRDRPDLPLLSVVREKGVILRSTMSDEENRNFIPDDLRNYKVVREGNLVINKMKAWQGSLGIAPVNGIVSPAYFVFDFRIGDRRFGQALLRSKTYVGFFARASDGVRIGQWDLSIAGMKRIPVVIPPLPEQSAIVRFLDHADRRIRRSIRAKKRLIALLNDQKQAIIHRAITRGLDHSVQLKPSGVEWLGDVPENWEIKRLRNLTAKVTSGSRGWSDYAADSGPLFIRIGNLTRTSIDLDFSDVVKLNLPDSVLAETDRTKVMPGDILLSITAFIGSVALVPEGIGEAYVSQHVACCRLAAGAANAKWVAYVLLSPIGKIHGTLCMYGGTKQGLSLDDVKNHVVLLPTREEQDLIIQRLDAVLALIDEAIRATQREINLLAEYHARLIADVVTGKLDVREAAARLPAETEEPEPLEDEARGEDDEAETADPDAESEEAVA